MPPNECGTVKRQQLALKNDELERLESMRRGRQRVKLATQCPGASATGTRAQKTISSSSLASSKTSATGHPRQSPLFRHLNHYFLRTTTLSRCPQKRPHS